MRYVLNPETWLLVAADGPTHLRLAHKHPNLPLYQLGDQKVFQMKISRAERKALAACPCFLLPPHSHYNPTDYGKYATCLPGSCKLNGDMLRRALLRASLNSTRRPATEIAHVREQAVRLLERFLVK